MTYREAFTYDPLAERSYDIGLVAHGDQLYGDRPYMEHPSEVALLAKLLGYNVYVVAGCLLHDTLEDTAMTPELLVARQIPLVVVEGVQAVTSFKGEAVEQKLARAMSSPLSHVVKFCDASRNFATTVNHPERLPETRRLSLAQRYAAYVGVLGAELPSPAEVDRYVQAYSLFSAVHKRRA